MVPPKGLLSLKQILCQKIPKKGHTQHPTQMPPVLFVAEKQTHSWPRKCLQKSVKNESPPTAQNGGLQYHGLSLPSMLL